MARKSKRASRTYKGKSLRAGGGGRFARLANKIKRRGGVSNPKAVAAVIGRRKYGAKKMAEMSAAGRRRAARKRARGG